MIPHIASFHPCDGLARVFDHEQGLHARATGQGIVYILFEGNPFTATVGLVRRNDNVAIAIQDAVFQRIRRKTAKHDGMDSPDPGASQHGDGSLRDVRQVNTNTVTFSHAFGFQGIGQAADHSVQLAVGDFPDLSGIIAFPDNGGLFAASRQMPV